MPSEPVSIKVNRAGDWMPVEELRKTVLELVHTGHDFSIDLDGVTHLDASALQVLLGAQLEQKNQGHRLDLLNASSEVLAWFDYAGATKHFFR